MPVAGAPLLRPRGASTPEERAAFARLVREGFETDPAALPQRVDAASCLAFHHAADGALVGVAALKAPPAPYRTDVFRQAGTSAPAEGYEHELGWIYVAPGHRGRGIATALCAALLAREPAPVFATTRPDNAPMIHMLESLGFTRVGRSYQRGQEQLALFLRPRVSGLP